MSSKGRMIKETPRLLWIGDAVAHTGFATVTHGVLEHLYKKYDVHVLGVNYLGDPHTYPYKIYPAAIGGDLYGINRIPSLLKAIKPHVTLIINDPWIVREYLDPLDTVLGKTDDGTEIRTHTVGYMPVDAKNVMTEFVAPLNRLDRAVCYTQFGLDELRKSGLAIRSDIIPHGINATEFQPLDRNKARQKLNLDQDWFIVGCINRNQPRKRLDLMLKYFADWVKDKPDNVRLYYHGAIQDMGWNIVQLSEYYGVGDRLIITSPELRASQGVTRDMLRHIYCSFNVQISTTMGEGWGLTQMEGMACRIPQIVPEWSGLADWARGGVAFVPCTSEGAHPNGLNTVGGIADEALFLQELERMYTDAAYRDDIADRGYELVTRPEYKWLSVAQQFDKVLTDVTRQVSL